MGKKNKKKDVIQNLIDEKHLEKSYSVLEYSSIEFDKSIVFIASGGLAISMTVLEKFIDVHKATDVNLLMISWYSLGATIIFSLIGHYISSLANRWCIINKDHDNFEELQSVWNKWLSFINILMITLICIGILLFLIFIHLNLK